MALDFPVGQDRLPPGLHRATLAEIRGALVEAFPGSKTRRPIFDSWTLLRQAIRRIIEPEREWVDGSYVTRKQNPGDVDLVTHLNGLDLEALCPVDQTLLRGLIAGHASRDLHRCDSFPLVVYPEGHPAHAAYQEALGHWERWFGHDRDGSPRGIVEVDRDD